MSAHASGSFGLRMTADEFLAMGETQERYELIDGVVVISPSPTPVHQLLQQEVLVQLGLHARAKPGTRVFPDTDVRLSAHRVYRPDICAYGPGRLTRVPSRLTSPPDLVIEILSPGSKPFDLVTKRDDYETFGVGEYWAIDPDDASIRCWRRQTEAGASKLVEWTPPVHALACDVLQGFSLELEPLRAIVRQAE